MKRLPFKILLLIPLLVILQLCYYYQSTVALSNIQVLTEDNQITVKWDEYNFAKCKTINIKFENNEQRYSKTFLINPSSYSFIFTEGKHGIYYVVTVYAYSDNNILTDSFEATSVFLDFNQLAEMPFIIINTASGDDPTFQEAEKPDSNLWGATQTNNKYIYANFSAKGSGITSTNNIIQIRTRGNTSNFQDKHSYKLLFSHNVSLIPPPTNCSNVYCNEWVLLNCGYSLSELVK